MQIKGLHKNIYRLSQYAHSMEKIDELRKKLEEPILKWQKLKKKGLSDRDCSEVVGISRSKYYRDVRKLERLAKGILPKTKRPLHLRKPQWGEADKQLVLRIRRENPTYGKAKIATIMMRDFAVRVSQSTVGRILKHLKEKGLLTLSISAPRAKRTRKFNKHAERWTYGMKAKHIGELVQIDHMSVTKNNCSVKHFQAWDRKSKYLYATVYSTATALNAKKFLIELIENAPFPIKSIQVDGGSEFMREFEEECQKRNIALYVLPPKRPQYNGGVERGNRTCREEFYRQNSILADSVQAIRYELKKYINKYNSFRPHFNLNNMTPLQYIQNNKRGNAESHI